MPLYDYKCGDCGGVIEALRKYEHRDELVKCPACDTEMERQMSVPHLEPDGVYSHSPNIGDPVAFERRHEEAKQRQRDVERYIA